MVTAASEPADARLFASRRFVHFALAKALQLLAQNALIYGLFILVVREQESALATSGFVLTAIVPSIFLSLPGGVIADSLPVKVSLLSTMAARLAIAWLFFAYDLQIAGIIGLALAWWTVSQFFGPAESAALPSVAPQTRLASANAVLDGISLASQLVGAGAIAPLILKAFGSDGLFLTVLVLLVASTLFYTTIPQLTPPARPHRQRVSWVSSLPQGMRIIRSEPTLVRVTTLKILLDTGLTVVVVAVPAFIITILRTTPDNAVYIFSPGAVGLAVGLLISPLLLRVLPTQFVAIAGFALLVGVILTMPFIQDVARELDQQTFVPITRTAEVLRIGPAMAATVLLLPFGGLGISLVRVAARTAVYQHAPTDGVAQVFATQSALGSAVSPLPTLAAGLLVDSLEVRAVLVLVGSAMAILAILSAVAPTPSAKPPEVASAAG